MMAAAGKALTMFGLGHCSTCQRARAELAEAGWTVDFRDVALAPLSEDERQWLADAFGARIINRASLTWRGMTEAERAAAPVAQMGATPSVIKRPAIVAGEARFLGWTANVRRALGVTA